MFLSVAQVVWQRCNFTKNTATKASGVMFGATTANQTFINCSFAHNTAVDGGSAHFSTNTSTTFVNTRVEHSRAFVGIAVSQHVFG
jgi:hypothetical protein